MAGRRLARIGTARASISPPFGRVGSILEALDCQTSAHGLLKNSQQIRRDEGGNVVREADGIPTQERCPVSVLALARRMENGKCTRRKLLGLDWRVMIVRRLLWADPTLQREGVLCESRVSRSA